MTYRVPFVDPCRHYRRYKAEFDAAIAGCLDRGDLIARQQLRSFERRLAEYVGARYAVGVSSGYHALALSLEAAGIGPGDEVITVAHTFVATVSAIVHAGAEPVMVDVGADYNMDCDRVEEALTPRTKALLPVHLNGRVCDMERLMRIAEKHGLLVIEDACQAMGARFGGKRAGSFGAVGCWSFYPFKMLGGFGDGGAVTTNDPRINRTLTLLRFNGEDRQTGEYHLHGYTALLDNLQAAVLEAKLGHLDRWIEHRRRIAMLYKGGLSGVGDLRLPHFSGEKHFDVYQNYVIRTSRRDLLREFLAQGGIETLVSWGKPLWEHRRLGLGEHTLPETQALCREVLSLPMSAEIRSEQAEIVIDSIRRFFQSK